MIFKYSVMILGLAISSLASAAVTIVAPEDIVVLKINDQDVKAGFLRKEKNYQVQSGTVNLQVRYQQFFDHGDKPHDVLKSGVLVLSAENLQDQQAYTLKLIDPPKSFDEAQKYVDHPVIALVDQQQNIVTQQDRMNVQDKRGLLQLLNLNFDQNRTDKIIKSQESIVKSENSGKDSFQNHQSQKINSSPSKDQQLIEIWKQSSKVERQKFMTWLAEQ